MEVIVPTPAAEFNFDSACTTPYISAPSSPQRFGNFYFSAPTSPTRSSSFYRELNDLSLISAGEFSGTVPSSAIPFDWEEKPGVPKSNITTKIDETEDFAFDFSGQLERTSLSADELFDGGKIKPLKPPPRLQLTDSPRSPQSPINKNIFKEALSPRHRNNSDPFVKAIEQTRKGRDRKYEHEQRGNANRKGTRSLSPLRVSELYSEQEQAQIREKSANCNNSKPSSSSTSSNSSKGYRKWRFKDFLLFRSASEGRAAEKDPLQKYSLVSKKNDDVKNMSFRSTDSAGSMSRRRGPVSPHEIHYTVNRAVSEEMKRKTFLPYKQGLLGCLGFNSAVQEISKGLGSWTRG